MDSVYIQDYENLELIVVDDGSTDGSKEKILAWESRFREKHMTIKYVYQKNKGLGGAISTGLSHISGDFLMLLDADDAYLPGAVSKRIAYFEAHPQCNTVRANGWMERESGKYLFVYEEKEKIATDIFEMLLRGETNNWAGSYMVRVAPLKNFYKDRIYYPSRYGQNLQILLPVVYENECGFIDEPLMRYIQQENSLSRIDIPEKEKSKILENTKGYLDIREHLIREIVQDPEKQMYYLNSTRAAYWRGMLHLGTQYKDHALAKKALKCIKKYEKTSIDDRIAYYHLTNPFVSYFYRAVNKIEKVLCRSKHRSTQKKLQNL